MEKIQAGSSGFDLSEAGKAAPEKLKTMIRHPIKAKGIAYMEYIRVTKDNLEKEPICGRWKIL